MIIQQYSQASITHPDRCEDALLVVQSNGCAPVFVVIDGMGGHQHQLADGKVLTGRDAALLLRDTLAQELDNLPIDIDAEPGGAGEKRVAEAFQRANQRLYDELNQGEQLDISQRVGAVLTVVVVCENGKRLLCMQIGDTRAYLYSDGELIQLCYDEDNIELLVEQGMLSAEDGARIGDLLNNYDGVNPPPAEGSVTINGQPFDLYIAWRWFVVGNNALGILPANIVLHAFGIEPDIDEPQVSRIEISPGDTLMLCSDGVYKNITDDEMIAALEAPGDSATALGDAACQRSQDTTNQRRTPDDISALVVHF